MSRGMDEKGIIFNIQHYCYDDGPGVRTTVFLKGCSLHCKWCGNPESIQPQIQTVFDPKLCMGVKKCGLCLKKPFPEGIAEASKDDPEKIIFHGEKAGDIKKEIVQLCPAGAIFQYGKEVTVQEVIEEVDQDAGYYGQEGGITVSGGEPLLQPQFTKELLKAAHSNGYTTAIETAGNVPWENIEMVFPYVDTVLHDIKVMDESVHTLYTGVSNKKILENWKKAYEKWPDKTFIVRTPIIPGVNNKKEAIEQILEFIAPYENVKYHELLPYHKYGVGKYELLGQKYPLSDEIKTPGTEEMTELKSLVKNQFCSNNKA